jgi:hypothetical protein
MEKHVLWHWAPVAKIFFHPIKNVTFQSIFFVFIFDHKILRQSCQSFEMFQALPLSVSKTIEKKFLNSQGNATQTPPALHITKWVSGTCHLGGEQGL